MRRVEGIASGLKKAKHTEGLAFADFHARPTTENRVAVVDAMIIRAHLERELAESCQYDESLISAAKRRAAR